MLLDVFKTFDDRKATVNGLITVNDLQTAEAKLIKYEQRQCFDDMLKRVPNGIQVSSNSPSYEN